MHARCCASPSQCIRKVNCEALPLRELYLRSEQPSVYSAVAGRFCANTFSCTTQEWRLHLHMLLHVSTVGGSLAKQHVDPLTSKLAYLDFI